MSIYDKASLVLIPSGTKTSKVYSQKPTNGDGDFTFSRSTAATRVNASGNIEKETQNLLLQSNSFDSWGAIGSSVTGGQSGYDGSSDAWLVSKNVGSARVFTSVNESGVNTYSVYAKAGALNWVRIMTNGSNTRDMYFDLANGALGTSTYGGLIDSTITSLGSGWYRCTISVNETITLVRVYPADSNGFVGGTSGNIYIQDAQLEQGLVARDYIETTTTAIYGGITDNVPRLDYTDSSCPALLLEPQRTNLFKHSEYFDGSLWSATNITITNNDAESPEGINNASKIVLDSGSSSSCELRAQNNKSVTLGDDYTFSVFAKADEFDKIELDFSNSRMGDAFVVANLTNGTITSRGAANTSDSIEDYGDGWYRIILTGTAIATGTTALIFRLGANPTGDGTSGFHIYGAQFEAGSYATSYIPTYGSAVTRNGETCNSAGTSATFNDSEGVLFGEISALSNDQTNRRITISDGTNTNRVVFGYNQNSNQIFYFVIAGGSTIASGNYTTTDITDFHKVAVKYKVNDFALWIDGVERHTDSSGAIFAADTLSEMQFEQGAGGSLHFYGNTKQVIYIPTALTDAELADLTTL